MQITFFTNSLTHLKLENLGIDNTISTKMMRKHTYLQQDKIALSVLQECSRKQILQFRKINTI